MCGVVERVDDDDSTAGPRGGVDDSLEGVDEQLGAESLAVEGLVECHSGDQVPRESAVAGAAGSAGEIDARELRRGDGVVGDDGAVVWRCPDGGPRDASTVGAERVSLEPAIEELVAGAELRDGVVLGE